MANFSERDLPDLSGRTAVVTGASGGIGAATARALAAKGARVVCAVRDVEKGKAAAARMPGTVDVRQLDLANLGSVRAFATGWDGPIDLLINNAGVSMPTLTHTADGFESTFGVNHLGHFALTVLVLPHLAGRVVTVASQAERMARLDLDDLDRTSRPYREFSAYADSKLANLLFTAELQRRLTASGSTVTAHAAHPGLVATDIGRHPGPRRMADVLTTLLHRLVAQTPADGALPTLFAAVADVPPNSFAGPSRLAHMRGAPQLIGRSDMAWDADLARRLWVVSERLTSVAAPV